MTISILIALLGFAFVATVTPGPNNLMLMAAGANFGFRRSMPHMLGIVAGVSIMTLLVGAGLMTVFEAFPIVITALKILSVAYMLWLAFKIAIAAPIKNRSESVRPMTFLQAAAFQWVNPKAWAMGISAVTLYAPDHSLISVAIIAAAFALVCFPAISVWTWLGTIVSRWLSSTIRLRVFNITMATVVLVSLYPALA